MSATQQMTRAYAAAQNLRGLREQEADLFLRANAALRQSREGGPLARVRALSDTSRLWRAVIDIVRDPANALPDPLKASLVSVGHAVQREVEREDPDVDFLLAVNADLAAGLGARA